MIILVTGTETVVKRKIQDQDHVHISSLNIHLWKNGVSNLRPLQKPDVEYSINDLSDLLEELERI